MAAIELTAFCGEGDGFKPLVRGGWRYYTDGRICVRAATTDPDDPDAGTRFIRIEEAFAPLESVMVLDCLRSLREWPAEPAYIKTHDECPVCDGSGRVDQKKCEYCKGDGECRCSGCGNTHNCGHCDGHGWVGGRVCANCKGQGRGVFDQILEISGRVIAWVYAEKIRALPGVRYLDVADAAAAHGRPLVFVFDGGQGAVMPLSITPAEARRMEELAKEGAAAE